MEGPVRSPGRGDVLPGVCRDALLAEPSVLAGAAADAAAWWRLADAA